MLLSLTGCSLDEHPRDQIAEEEAYTSLEALFQNTVSTLYSYIGGYEDGQGLQGTCRGVYDLQTFGSDEAILPTRGVDWYDGGIWQQLYMHSWTSGHSVLQKSWLYLYKVITLCNRSLEILKQHSDRLNILQLKAMQAEVRALRATYYWYLLDLFGRVPIITSTDISINEVQQAKRSEVFHFVVDELREVCELAPVGNSVARGNSYARVTQSVIYFVLAKLMLNAEVYTDDDPTDHQRKDGSEILFTFGDGKKNAWEATIHYCDLIEKEGYVLEANYQDNFAVRNEYSKENIWVIASDKDLYTSQQQNMYRSWHYRHAAVYGFNAENGSCATKRTLHIFGYGTPDQDSRFDMNYWAGTVYDLWYNEVTDRTGEPLIYYPWEVKMDLSGGEYVETAGARMKKYEVDLNATKYGKLMDNDIVLFRFSDVLLMRAEAKLRLGGATCAEGFSGMTAQEDYDAVRQRVGMPTRQLTLENLLDERLLEFCWEGWRRQDLIRFGQYESLFEGDATHVKVDESDGHTTLFPIPADALTMNANLTQNKGY